MCSTVDEWLQVLSVYRSLSLYTDKLVKKVQYLENNARVYRGIHVHVCTSMVHVHVLVYAYTPFCVVQLHRGEREQVPNSSSSILLSCVEY